MIVKIFFPSSHPKLQLEWPEVLNSSRGLSVCHRYLVSKKDTKVTHKKHLKETLAAFNVLHFPPSFNQLTCALLNANMILVVSSPPCYRPRTAAY